MEIFSPRDFSILLLGFNDNRSPINRCTPISQYNMTKLMQQIMESDVVDPFDDVIPYHAKGQDPLTGDNLEYAKMANRVAALEMALRSYTTMFSAKLARYPTGIRNYVGGSTKATGSSTAPVYTDFTGGANIYAIDITRMTPKDAEWVKKNAPKTMKLGAEHKALNNKAKKLKKTIDSAHANTTQSASAAAAQAAGISVGTQIPAAQIPQYIQTGASKFANPWHNNVVAGEQYAGHPSAYNFSSVTSKTYAQLETLLKANGLTLTTMYAGRPKPGVPINFGIITNNGKFVWRKYDMGGASGQNFCLLNGQRYQTSSLIAMPPAQFTALLKKTGVI